MRKKRKKLKKKVFLMIVFLGLLGVFFTTYCFLLHNDVKVPELKLIKKIVQPKEEKKLKIVDLDSDSRPYAVMINNHPTARAYHVGLQEAYLVYEIIVEGGYTRLMAVYKDAELEKIGSVRSSRHYFLDYALENDAVYVHWGWSPEAQSDISRMGINNINGLSYEGVYFFRDNSLNVNLEHRGFTKTAMIKDAMNNLGYRATTKKDLLLNYSIDDIDLSKMEGALAANDVEIKYSTLVTTSYKYNADKKVYERFVNSQIHKDYNTGKQYTAKNIITYQVANYLLAGDTYGRQDIDNLGSGDGYLISDGYAVPIKWEKGSRESQTKYTYLNGEEIKVNDGNTFIQIQPSSQSLVIK